MLTLAEEIEADEITLTPEDLKLVDSKTPEELRQLAQRCEAAAASQPTTEQSAWGGMLRQYDLTPEMHDNALRNAAVFNKLADVAESKR